MGKSDEMADTISNAAMKDLVDTAVALGEITHSDLAKIDISLSAIEQPQLRCSESLLIHLWQWLDTHAKRPDLGLKIGSVINPAAKGLLASWVSQASTLGEALTIFSENISLMSPSEKWDIVNTGDLCTLEFRLDAHKGYPVMAIERSLAALVTWGRALCAQPLKIRRAEFAFSRPDHSLLYTEIFGPNLTFDSDANRLVFSRDILHLPVQSSNDFLKSMMAKAAEQAKNDMASSVTYTYRVMNEIETRFDQGLDVSMEAISDALSVSRQTLFRKLKDEGCDFKRLLEQFKKERALQLLVSSKHNITSVGLTLGYKDSSSFTKAFKRWYGMTPKTYLETQPIKSL